MDEITSTQVVSTRHGHPHFSSGHLIWLTLLGFACSDGATDAGRALPHCRAELYESCDLRDELCQSRMFELVSCARQNAFGSPPPVDFMTRSDFATLVEAEENARPRGTELVSLERGYGQLRLLEPADLGATATAARRLHHVTASYSVDEKRVRIVVPTTSEPLTHPFLRLVMAHEFVHVLQDREHDLLRFFSATSQSYDSRLAARSVSEGEAQLYALLLLAGSDGAQAFADGTVDTLRAELAGETSALAEAPYTFPYTFGLRHLHRIWTEAGVDATRALFASPPSATLPIIAPDAALAEARALGALAPEPDAGYSLVESETLGTWLLMAFVAAFSDGDIERAQQIAQGWRGDRVWIYAGPTEAGSATTAVVWKIAFESGQATLCALLEPQLDERGACRDHEDHSAFAFSDGESPDAWL